MNTQTTEKSTATDLRISMLFNLFARRIWWLILAVVIGAGGTFLLTKLLVVPQYSSTAEFRVENIANSAVIVTGQYATGAEQYARNYVNEVKGNVFLDKIVEDYNIGLDAENPDNLPKLTTTKLANMITVSAKTESNLFYVKVSSPNPKEAHAILQIFEAKSPQYLVKEHNKAFLQVGLNHRGTLATSPDSPRVVRDSLIGGILAALVVYALFFLAAVLDKTVYGEEQLKETFKAPVVGTLPEWLTESELAAKSKHVHRPRRLFRLKQRYEEAGHAIEIQRDYTDKLLNTHTPFFITESLKSLRTNLMYLSAAEENGYTLGITSSYAGAGKSLLAANIAVSFAQLEKKVLLIDGDMRSPVQHKVFSLDKHRVGLSEILAGVDKATFEDAVISNVYGGVDLLLSGRIPPNPAELFASKRMSDLLAELKQKYDYIFLDLPPVLETTDAGVLAGKISGYTMVVRAGYSNIDSVREAMENMSSINANVMGLILNDVNYKLGYGRYSYKYGSKYGSRYGRYSRYGYRYGRYSRYGRYGTSPEQFRAEQDEK